MHALSALAMGATGYLSSEGNLVPRLVNSVAASYAAGDHVAAADVVFGSSPTFRLPADAEAKGLRRIAWFAALVGRG